MNLEDHLGDIVRKARQMTHTEPDAAAVAGGISSTQLSELESTGRIPAGISWTALGAKLNLDGHRLDRIAKGWLPAPKDLSTWRELRVITTSDGEMSVNSYLVWDEVSREGALFDTGFDAQPILDLIKQEQVTLKHIFVTHSHGDHVAALPALREHFPKVKLHSNNKSAPVDQRNRPNDFIHLGSLRITNRDTPGHAEDGVTYIIGTWPEDAPHVAIVGDAIFAGSMGRGNISWEVARQKVRDQILSLPGDTLLCPGHGPLTTVAEEKANNPFFP
jgi:glyoxylase-like metal-dependent hydrolase (beta-lactamase superfamily II)